jgi:hypothetical protein
VGPVEILGDGEAPEAASKRPLRQRLNENPQPFAGAGGLFFAAYVSILP